MDKRDIVYFNYCGEVNIADLLHLARQRAEVLNTHKVVSQRSESLGNIQG